MDQGLAIVLAGSLAVLSPVLLNWLQNRNRAAEIAGAVARRQTERAEDLAERRQVAEQAAKAAALLHDSQVQLVARTDEVAKVAAVAVAKNEAAVAQIHTLVNSTLDEAQKGHLEEARESLTLAAEVVAIIRAAGNEPTIAQLARVSSKEAKIADLEALVASRATQLAAANLGVKDATDTAELVRRGQL